MQWIILIGNESFNISSIKELELGQAQKSILSSDRLVFDFGDEHVFFDFVDDLINDYEKAEITKLPFPKPCFVMMTYTSKVLMKKVLESNNFSKVIYIDDDHGNISPINEFVNRLKDL